MWLVLSSLFLADSFWAKPAALLLLATTCRRRWRWLQWRRDWLWGLDSAQRQGSTWITPQTQWFTRFFWITMVTNQLAIKSLVRANLIPKLYRLSWQTFWSLFPFKFFLRSSPALSEVLGYPTDRCGYHPHHYRSSTKPPNLTLSFLPPFILFLLTTLLATWSIEDIYWLIGSLHSLWGILSQTSQLAWTFNFITGEGNLNFLGKAKLGMRHSANTQYEKLQDLWLRLAIVSLPVSDF